MGQVLGLSPRDLERIDRSGPSTLSCRHGRPCRQRSAATRGGGTDHFQRQLPHRNRFPIRLLQPHTDRSLNDLRCLQEPTAESSADCHPWVTRMCRTARQSLFRAWDLLRVPQGRAESSIRISRSTTLTVYGVQCTGLSKRRSAFRPSSFFLTNPRFAIISSIEQVGCCRLWKPDCGRRQGQFRGQSLWLLIVSHAP